MAGARRRVHADADRSAAEGIRERPGVLPAGQQLLPAVRVLPARRLSRDPEVREVGQLSVDSFARAAQLMNPTPERVRFPTRTPRCPDGGSRRSRRRLIPTAVTQTVPGRRFCTTGASTAPRRSCTSPGGAAAARRGYHVLAFAGPGQGSALRDQKLLFRPDWDAVVTPAVDWLLARPDVDPDRIALMGMSFGGLLAPRAAATEHRLAALIAYDGLYSFADVVHRWSARDHEAHRRRPRHKRYEGKRPHRGDHELQNQYVRPGPPVGMWVFGEDSPAAALRAFAPYTLEGYAPLVTCPTLVLDGENKNTSSAACWSPTSRRTTAVPGS